MIRVNTETCIGCGMCEKDCLASAIRVEDGKAKVKMKCMECGHCVAVCPVGAVTMDGAYDMADVMPYDAETFKVPVENFLSFLKFRRSTRQYQQKAVEQEKLERVVEARRYTPTASNGQNVHFVVVQEQMEQVKDLTWEGLERMLEAGEISHYRGMLQRFIDRRKADKTQDALFFGAPVLVVLTCEGPWNGPLAARSMELMAEAEGLGSLYSGFIQRGIFYSPEVQELLGITGEQVAVCMLMGYPAVKYRRTVPRKKANVTWK
ncbi:nitroreductase family protein [Anaerotignum sp.]|uniref:nitroreductase family protein n=1 Tax=Anaerotignum sp. TaxID=2039241 RepID=UPI003A86C02E